MIDFNALAKATKYADNNVDEYFRTCMHVDDSNNWTEIEKKIFKDGVYNGLIHGYYNALINKEK